MKNAFFSSSLVLFSLALFTNAGCSPRSQSVSAENMRPGAGLVATANLKASITEIDYKNRLVTLRSEDGKTSRLHVGPEARNFDQAAVGDVVTVGIFEAFVVDVQPDDGTSTSATVESRFDRARLGEKPRGMISNTITLRATVDEIDYARRLISLRGPGGNSVTMKVGEEARRFSEVKKGDSVVVVYSEAVVISVSTPNT